MLLHMANLMFCLLHQEPPDATHNTSVIYREREGGALTMGVSILDRYDRLGRDEIKPVFGKHMKNTTVRSLSIFKL